MFIKYDLQRFTQIINNVINNAIIAMDSKESKISFSTLIKSNKLSLTISDTGKGISNKDLQNIFDRFYRVDTSRNRNSGGSGLGLSIVKFLIESHTGKIKMQSTLNVGTDVSIDIKDFYLS